MASWLKAADDLFEVVDRRAKLAITDLSDEQSDSKSPASNGQGSQDKRAKSKPKARKGLSNPSTITSDATKEQSESPAAPLDVTTPRDKVDLVAKSDESASISTNQAKEQQPTDATSPILGTLLSKMLASDVIKHDTGDVEESVNDTDVKVTTVSANGEPVKENASDIHEAGPSPSPKGIKEPSDEPTSTDQIIKSGDLDANQNTDQKISESVANDVTPNNDTILEDSDIKVEPIVNQKSQEDHKTDISPKKVQDQLDEAQGLLKTTKSTGQSKEARLARVCAGLSSCLQEYKSENAQLEELLTAEKLYQDMESRIENITKLGKVPKELHSNHMGFSQWDLYSSRGDHDTILQILLNGKDLSAKDVDGLVMPTLVYLAREKRPQIAHNFKAGAMNSLVDKC